jgi:hypothetical protein
VPEKVPQERENVFQEPENVPQEPENVPRTGTDAFVEGLSGGDMLRKSAAHGTHLTPLDGMFLIFCTEDTMADNDWLPGKEQDLVDLCIRWRIGLGDPTVVAAFGWDQVDVTVTLAALDAFLSARMAYKQDNSTRNRRIKDEAKEVAKRTMRGFANTSIRYNKLMKEEDKEYYGIHTHDPIPTPNPKPTTFPEAEADTSVLRQVTIHFWDSFTKKRGKPHGIHGAEIRWAILDHVPISVKELVNSDFDTATPFTLVFDESQRGQRLYFCLRWESTTNQKGPDGEIYSVVIP